MNRRPPLVGVAAMLLNWANCGSAAAFQPVGTPKQYLPFWLSCGFPPPGAPLQPAGSAVADGLALGLGLVVRLVAVGPRVGTLVSPDGGGLLAFPFLPCPCRARYPTPTAPANSPHSSTIAAAQRSPSPRRRAGWRP